jgi:hypothetical protein
MWPSSSRAATRSNVLPEALLRRSDHARAIRGSLLILLGVVLGLASYGTWAVRTYDFGLRQDVPGIDAGGQVSIVIAVILLGAGLGYAFGVGFARTVALVGGSMAFIYAIVRAAQLGAEDFPFGHTTEVEGALWIGITASALTILVALARARSSPPMRSVKAEPDG